MPHFHLYSLNAAFIISVVCFSFTLIVNLLNDLMAFPRKESHLLHKHCSDSSVVLAVDTSFHGLIPTASCAVYNECRICYIYIYACNLRQRRVLRITNCSF